MGLGQKVSFSYPGQVLKRATNSYPSPADATLHVNQPALADGIFQCRQFGQSQAASRTKLWKRWVSLAKLYEDS